MSDAASVNEVYGKEEQKGKARVRLGKWRVLTLKRPSDFLLPLCLMRIWRLSRHVCGSVPCTLRTLTLTNGERGKTEAVSRHRYELEKGAQVPRRRRRTAEQSRWRARDARVTVCLCLPDFKSVLCIQNPSWAKTRSGGALSEQLFFSSRDRFSNARNLLFCLLAV